LLREQLCRAVKIFAFEDEFDAANPDLNLT